MIKRTKYIFLTLSIILFIGFSSNANNYIKKWKTLTQVIRLVNENYVEEVDMNEILDGAIIGKKGFGFFPGKNKNVRYPHIGSVIIGNDVEIA